MPSLRPVLLLLLLLAAGPAAAEDRFRVRLDIGAAASARLLELGRWIVVEAVFSGEARPGVPASDWGIASLGRESFTVRPVSQVVEFGGSLAAMPRDWTAEPRVWIEVRADGAPGGTEQILCDTVEQPLAALVEEGETLLECVVGG